jgi:hypothetical protein
VNDDAAADLDRLFARLSGEGHKDPDDHPAPEKLSAYQANELSAAEDDALQEHLVHCARCSELLLDLQRFLDPPPEDLPREGVVDFETAAQWREIRRRMGEEKALPVVAKRGLLTQIFKSPALAAVLALLLVGAAIQVMRLERELAQPITDLTPTTIEAPGTHKGPTAPAEPTPFRLGHVAAFDTHSPQTYPRFSLVFRDKNGQVKSTAEAPENEEGMIVLFLPRRFLAPGTYKVEVRRPNDVSSPPIRKFDIQILQ